MSDHRLILLCFHILVGEIIPLERSPSGCPWLVVDVEGAENNPQRVLIDTGSFHSYLLQNSMMRALPRARELPRDRIAGFRGSQIADNQLTVADGTHIDFDGFSGLRLQRWTRKRFTSGTHSWIQKFAVAVLPESQLATWNPNRSGLIGAGCISRFVANNPKFGFIPRRNGADLDMFVNEPINPVWCRDGRIVYAPVSDRYEWLFESLRISLGGSVITNDRVQILPDTGYGIIAFPAAVFDRFRNHLETLRIPSLVFPSDGNPRFERQHLSLIPDLTFTLVSGESITISKHGFCSCSGIRRTSTCSIFIEVYSASREIILGNQLLNSLIVEYDSSDLNNNRIGFCEPIDGAATDVGFVVEDDVPDLSPRDGRSFDQPTDDLPGIPIQSSDERIPIRLPHVIGEDNPSSPGKPPLRIPNDVVEDNDEADPNAEKQTGADQKATTRRLCAYTLPITMFLIASILIA